MTRRRRTWEYHGLNTLLAGVRQWLPDPLDPDRLLARARRITGLYDYGGDDFQEPYRLLLLELRHTAALTPLGEQLLSQSLLGFLENRLCLEADRPADSNPGETALRRPLYVIGFPRSGTTLLFNLLAQHAAARPLRLWEAMQPARRYRRGRPLRRDGRIGRARQLAWFINRQLPSLKTMHPLEALEPEESTWLLSNTFMSPAFSMQAYVPAYHEWLLAQPRGRWEQAYRYYRRTLLGLQQSTARSEDWHWVLRSPAHLRQLSVFLDTLPEARVVLPVRDPANVVGSCCSLLATVLGLSTDRLDPQAIGPVVLEGLAAAWESTAATRARHADRLAIIPYDGLMRDPVQTVTGLYARFGYRVPADFATRMEQWLERHPADRFGPHRYHLEDFGLTTEVVRERLASYTQAAASEPASPPLP